MIATDYIVITSNRVNWVGVIFTALVIAVIWCLGYWAGHRDGRAQCDEKIEAVRRDQWSFDYEMYFGQLSPYQMSRDEPMEAREVEIDD